MCFFHFFFFCTSVGKAELVNCAILIALYIIVFWGIIIKFIILWLVLGVKCFPIRPFQFISFLKISFFFFFFANWYLLIFDAYNFSLFLLFTYLIFFFFHFCIEIYPLIFDLSFSSCFSLFCLWFVTRRVWNVILYYPHARGLVLHPV